MAKSFRMIRNIFFAVNVISCTLLLACAIKFPSLLGIAIIDSLGLTIHMACMAAIFISVFGTAVAHQLYEQEKWENN